MSTVAIIQARMTSSRLPGKVLMPILGRPMLAYEIERLRKVRGVERIVLATTVNRSDDAIAELCATEHLDCYRGSEHDVLGRYYEASVTFGARVIVRVTADCPLLDPDVVERVLWEFSTAEDGCDYASNMITPTFPYGMAAEVFSFDALRDAHAHAREAAEREHVTPYIYWRPEQYRLRSVTMSPNLSQHRWTVDTADDFALINRILQALYPVTPDFRMADVLALVQAHPDWQEINRHVRQNMLHPREGARQ
jgi:spore coat polysaccharide biosynthesis protein SpsF